MAENINIASFDFDNEKLMKSLVDTRIELQKNQKVLADYRKSQQAQVKESERLAVENKVLANSLNRLKEEGRTASKEYEDLTNKMKDNEDKMEQLNSTSKTLTNEIIKQEASVNGLKNEYKLTSDVLKAVTAETGEFVSATNNATAAVNKEITSIASARANNKELLAIRNQLNPAIAEEAQLIQELNAKLDSNNAFIKENASAYEQQKINIGNYSESIQEAANNLNPLNGGLTGFIQRSQEAGGVGNLLTGSLKQMATGIAGVTKASLAFIATPVGAVLAVIAAAVLLVTNAMNRNEETQNKVSKALAPLTGWFNKLLEVLEPIGEFLVDVFVVYLDLVEKQLYAMIEALAWALETVGAEDWAGSVREFGNELEETANKSRELADAEAELEKNQRKSRLTQLEYQKEAEKFRQIRDNENLSIQQRIQANEQLGAVLQKQLQEELRLAQVALKVANLRIEQEGRTKEALDAQYAAMTEIADIEERITGQQSEQLTNRVSLQKEAEQKAQQARDEAERKREEAFRRELQRMNEELDLWIANQGIKARTLQEELDFERKVAEDSIKILDYELKNKKISRTKYQTEVLKLQNELGKLTAEMVAQNAEDELNEWLRVNQSILADENRLTDELILAEERRLNESQQRRIQFEQERLAEGLINERDYQNQILAITEETEAEKNAIKKRYADQQRAEEVVMRQLQFEEDLISLQERGATEFELQQAERDVQFQTELEKINAEREQNLISEEEYQARFSNIERKWNLENAQAIEQIEQTKQEAKMQLASQAFGLMAEILGKETAAGKAAAIAQTTIDTYKAAQSAYASLAGIPIVGPALGAVAAGFAVVNGLLNVKKIVSTKTPKVDSNVPGYATGGRIASGVAISRPNGDDVLITAKRGEVILNEDQQRKAGGYNFFSALGVPGFATGGVVGSMPASQSAFVQNQLVNQINVDAIRDAVREGAMEGSMEGSLNGSREGSSQGSQSGIRDLNSDIQILNNSAF